MDATAEPTGTYLRRLLEEITGSGDPLKPSLFLKSVPLILTLFDFEFISIR